MKYGPFRKTYQGEKNRIKGEYYWLYKKNEKDYSSITDNLRCFNGERLIFTPDWFKNYRNEHKEETKERNKEYYEKNKGKLKEVNKEYREKNKEKIKKSKRKHYEENKEDIIAKACQWRRDNPEKAREIRRRREKKTYVKIKKRVACRIRHFLKKNGASKDKTTLEYTCCDIQHLHNHLESQFTEGMNWENMGTKPDGTKGWQIDHRRPGRTFDYSIEEEKFMCFHWTNLQPLWAPVNQWEKGGKFDPETFEYEWKGREIGWKKIFI